MTRLQVKNLTMSYEGKQVLEEVSFQLGRGDYLFILGENGTGKTTLVKGLLGLKAIDRGSITFGGGVSKEDIGYLSQSTAMQKNFPATVMEILLSGMLNKKGFFSFYTRSDRKRAEELLDKLGIRELKNAPFASLSGGQQQRVLLCRALAAATKILVLDEPAAFLDSGSAADMYETLTELNRQDGLTVIMVSHDSAAAKKYASHILHLKTKPLYFGESAGYFESSQLDAVGGDGDE